MKRYLFVLFILTAGLSDAQVCQNPMPSNLFRQKLNQLALQSNDVQKLQYAKSFLPGSCMLSSQVKEMAMVFAGDFNRFEFSKRAWKHTYDKNNFYDVYDAFQKFSNALRLYDFVKIQELSLPPVPNPDPSATEWYPDLAYPPISGYNGTTGCGLPLADSDFEFKARQLVILKNDQLRRTEGLKLIASNCLTISQAMKISTLFELESNRLSFLKEIFSKLYDLENYSYVTEVFTHIPYKNDWLAFGPTIADPPAPQPPPVPVCEVSAAEFDDIKKSISNVSVNSTKVTLAKQIISTKKCFTVRQLAGIIELFSIESSRLEIALYGYDFCINKNDYYQLTESFYTTSSKNKLLEFIESKK